MSKYIELEAAKGAIAHADPAFVYTLDHVPTVEAEPVIYCKDCAKRGEPACAMDGLYYKINKDRDFCSHGVRRESE